MSAVTAINMLILRNKIPRGTPPSELYTFCKLWKKDKDRPRYQLLVRNPSREETVGKSVKPEIQLFMIKEAGDAHRDMLGKVIVRVRCTQGHSRGDRIPRQVMPLVHEAADDRIGQTEVPGKEYPLVIMHATTVAKMDSIQTLGLIPGACTGQEKATSLCAATTSRRFFGKKQREKVHRATGCRIGVIQ